MWIRIYDQTHSQKFFVGRSTGGAEQRQPVNHRCPERRCNKQLKYVGPIQKIEAAAININFSNDHPKCCFMEWSLLIWLTAPFHSPTAVPWGSKVAEKDSHHLVPPRDTWCLWEETPYRVKMGLAPALLPFWSLLWHTLCPTFRSTCHHPSSLKKNHLKQIVGCVVFYSLWELLSWWWRVETNSVADLRFLVVG